MKTLFTFIVLLSSASWARPQPIYFDKSCEPGTQITIGAVGDFLIHDPLQKKAERQGTFRNIWRRWLDYTLNVDQMYGNLEVPTARGHGKDGQIVDDPGLVYDRYVHTSFPMFNVHPQLLKDIVDSGFDVISTANNHALDRGVKGLDATIDELESAGLAFTGTRRLNETRDMSVQIESKGIRVAWLACTMVLNSPDRQKQVLHCQRDWSQVREMIQRLARTNDAVVITPHWGEENKNYPNDGQVRLARQMLEAGAIAVLGAHPHVLQPMEKYITRDGRETFVIYSLANFVSFQPRVEEKSSMMLFLGFTKNSRGETFINGVRYIPALMRNRTGNFMDVELLPLEQAQRDPLYVQVKEHIEGLFPEENESKYGQRVVTNSECGF